MKLATALLLTILLGAPSLSAQNPSADGISAGALVEGLVSKDPTGEAVKKAVIELISENQGEGGNYTAATGPDGSFRIENIRPGRYRLFIEKTGYLEVDKHRAREEGQVLTLTAGQHLKDLLIRLQAAAVVSGRVTDEDGDPLPNAQVSVLRQTFASGHNHWEQAGGERTNDLGDYRIANLAAGSYYISVSPPPNFKSLIETAGNVPADPHAAPGSADKPAPTSYMTTYYPGTKDRSQATPIPLHAGDDFPVNFSLTPGPSLMVRGSVVNLPPGASAVVMLQSREFSVMLNGADIHKDGSFEIRDVAPGAYTLVAMVAESPVPMMARQALEVTSANVDGLRLAPQSGAWVHGRIRLESKSNLGKLDPSQLFLSLHSADGDDEMAGGISFGEGFSTLARVAADGSFEWKSVPAGRYYLQLAGDAGASPDWFLKSVVAGNRDASDAGFSVSGGAAVVDLVASANGASVTGVVTNHKGEPMPNAVVFAVPEARLRQRMDRYRKTVSDQRGGFILHGLPPGAYTLFAWESVDGEAYYDPEFLKRYEGQGSVLHVAEGELKSVQLEAAPADEDQQ